MRVIFSPALYDRGADLLRQVGKCRACGKRNIIWLCRGHVVTRASIGCEYCGSRDSDKKKPASEKGIQWSAKSSVWSGRVMAQNYPEMARPGDLVM